MALYKSGKFCNLRGHSLLCKALDTNLLLNYPNISEVSRRSLFWERDRKAGYDSKEKISTLQHIRNGVKEFKKEFKLLTKEIKDHVSHPVLFARPVAGVAEPIVQGVQCPRAPPSQRAPPRSLRQLRASSWTIVDQT